MEPEGSLLHSQVILAIIINYVYLNSFNSISHFLMCWFNSTSLIIKLIKNMKTEEAQIYKTYLKVRFTTESDDKQCLNHVVKLSY